MKDVCGLDIDTEKVHNNTEKYAISDYYDQKTLDLVNGEYLMDFEPLGYKMIKDIDEFKRKYSVNK